MSDENTPPREETPEEKERREAREALFEDIEDGAGNDSEIVAALTQQVASLTTALQNAQRDNLANHTRAEEAKRTITRMEAKAKEDEKYAIAKFVKEVLPVIDTLELGLKSIPVADRDSDPKFAKLVDGVEKTISSLTQVFNRFGISEINPINQEFDENKHEALAVVPKPDTEPGTVIDVAQKGYEINGRIIRAAKVVVTPPDM